MHGPVKQKSGLECSSPTFLVSLQKYFQTVVVLPLNLHQIGLVYSLVSRMPHSVVSDMDMVSHSTHTSICELYCVSFSATALLQAAVSVFLIVIIIIAFY